MEPQTSDAVAKNREQCGLDVTFASWMIPACVGRWNRAAPS
jgi:hypothetical protein